MVKKTMVETNTGFINHIGGLSLNKLDAGNFDFSIVKASLTCPTIQFFGVLKKPG